MSLVAGGRDWLAMSSEIASESAGFPDPVTQVMGQVLFRAADRTERDMMLEQGHGSLRTFLIPVYVGFFALVPVVLALQGLNFDLTPLPLPVRLAVLFLPSLLVCSYFYWRLYRQPATGSLVLYEKGFGYKKKLFLFEDLNGIVWGARGSSFQRGALALNRALGTIKPSTRWAGEVLSHSLAQSWTLLFKDATTLELQGLAIRCDWKDLDQFVRLVNRRFPNMIRDAS